MDVFTIQESDQVKYTYKLLQRQYGLEEGLDYPLN